MEEVIKPLTEEELKIREEKAKKSLIASYEMYENSIEETKKRREEAKDKYGNPMYGEEATRDTIQLMETMKRDVVDKFIELGGTEEELKSKVKNRGKKKTLDRAVLKNIIERDGKKEELRKQIEEMRAINENTTKNVTSNNVTEEDSSETSPEVFDEPNFSTVVEDIKPIKIPEIKQNKFNVGNKIQWDYVPLPSGGECYKSKLDKVPVGYLTAYDENLIVSPNLYKDGTFLDELLKAKIMNSSIDVDNLLPGDRDAIILWLRGTSYGVDFPVTATDNETGKQFDAVIDLTSIKPKEFKLKGDENGYFDFELPVSKDKVKFRFLTYGDLKRLEEIEKEELVAVKKKRLEDIIKELTDFVNTDEKCDKTLKKNLTAGIQNFEKYRDSIEEDSKAYSHMITNKLFLSIVSVNGIDNRDYITEYISYMNVRDSSALRKYITENEPGLDFNIEVERPESLGGGSIRMFLTLDQFIFLNIA